MTSKPQLPIVNLGILNASGCVHAPLSATSISISAGQVRDSTNTFDIVVPQQLVASLDFVGPGGLDKGTIAASTFYAVFVLYDSSQENSPVALLSTSSTPTMPSLNGVTYSHFRLIGYIKTSAASAIVPFRIIGNGNDREHFWIDGIEVLAAGDSTSYLPVSLSNAVPAIMGTASNAPASIRTCLGVEVSPGSAGAGVILSSHQTINESYTLSGAVVGVKQVGQLSVVADFLLPTDYTIFYVLTSASSLVDLNVNSFSFNV